MEIQDAWLYLLFGNRTNTWPLRFYLSVSGQILLICNWSHKQNLCDQNFTKCISNNRLIGPVGRMFANGPGDQGSIPAQVIPKTLKNGT